MSRKLIIGLIIAITAILIGMIIYENIAPEEDGEPVDEFIVVQK